MPISHDQAHHPEIAACRWFPGDATSIRDVRRFITTHLNGCPRSDAAALLASELATNALHHTLSSNWTTGFHVTIEHTPTQHARVTVHDAGSWNNTPHLTQPGPDTEHGRGLYLVDTIADHWGTHTDTTGRKTWATLHCHSPAPHNL
ncbi:ATP-binding protein [Salinactinospora qingdaonensis]|uniref:Histidine kinase/HSP90-like ATPase domain-containing protein n=1 Tax=Salinactinospora qingdaonensis TaxID=702744 RepID=A0ABP7ETK2_9ACTN